MLEREYIQAHYLYAPSHDTRMQYLRAQPPDGSVEWWVALASSDEIQQAAAHIRVETQRLVGVIRDPAAKHPRMPQLHRGGQRRIDKLLQGACAWSCGRLLKSYYIIINKIENRLFKIEFI